MPLKCIAKYQVITMHKFKCIVPLRKKIKEIRTEFKKGQACYCTVYLFERHDQIEFEIIN